MKAHPQVKAKRRASTRGRTRLRCATCGAVFTAEKRAEDHARETGHSYQDAIMEERR